jgi:membrane-bound inhibitor of C-type lysozyme
MRLLVTLAALPALTASAFGAESPASTPAANPAPPAITSSIQVNLGATGDFERKVINYGCQGRDHPLPVEYLNAAPNFLALVPVEEGTLLFTTVLAASGAKYAAGKYVWWTKGPEASLYDLTQGDNSKPILSCSEVNETP